ncbi:MAG: metallophosphoesterase [Halohasta sp.]
MDEFVFRDRAIYLPSTETLVVADLHLGREATASVDAPLGERRDLLERLAGLREGFEPTRIVFAGDLLHSFSTVPDGVAETARALYHDCVDDGLAVVAIEGNHDRMLDTVWPGEIESAVELDDGTVVCHGHQEPPLDGDRYVIGHDHPAIRIEGVKRPCLCVDPAGYRGAELVVLPAFTRLAGGRELNGLRADALQSPLVGSVASLRPVVWDPDRETALRFPPLGEFRRLL